MASHVGANVYSMTLAVLFGAICRVMYIILLWIGPFKETPF